MKQKYNKYKSSGVEWIGEIPKTWRLIRLKFVSNVIPSNVDKHIFEDERKVRLCNYTDVYHKDFIDENTELKYGSCSDDEFDKYSLVKGDVVITKDSESPNDIGIPCLIKSNFEDVVCGYHLSIIRSQDEILGGYLYNQLTTKRIKSYFEVESNGITRYGLGKSSVLDTLIILPSIQEQEQIVKYLDDKTSQIDQLISITEKKIEGLKEKRTSLINHVVTKGLDSNVELKDSGVEWIGEIPKHWEVIPIKHLVETNQRVLREDTPEDYELDYIEISDVNNVGEIINKTRYFFKETPSRCRRILQKNDVFVSTVRTYLKSIGFVKDEVQDLICSTGFCVLSPNTLKVNPEFLFLLISTEWFLGSVISNSEGVSYPSITSTKLIELKTLLPPLIEQELIVKHIESHTTEIDNLISLEKKRIETLKEYRQSLISEVVTGKIRVCEEVSELQEN